MSDSREIKSTAPIRLGLRENLPQFSLLVLVNAFVGAMVGLERTVLPLIAEQDFGLASKTAILSFIATFGIVKALSNLLAGRLSDRVGRKKILVVGWLAGLPVPFMVIWAPTWNWIVLANVLLGINQGLCWSTTVIMKIDLVGPSRRGLAMGLERVCRVSGGRAHSLCNRLHSVCLRAAATTILSRHRVCPAWAAALSLFCKGDPGIRVAGGTTDRATRFG